MLNMPMPSSWLPSNRTSQRHGIERRSEPRMHVPLQVKVCGTDMLDQVFEVEASVDNISRSGLYLRLDEQVAVGSKLLIFMRPLSVDAETETTPFGVIRAIVRRVERQEDGSSGLGLQIAHRRQQEAPA